VLDDSTILWVKCHTSAKRTAWVRVMFILGAVADGRVKNCPGVKTTKRTNR